MGSNNVVLPLPLTRLNPWFPGQFGVSGTSNKTGLRTTCEGAVFYVDPNAVGVSDRRDGTDADAPLATVAAALALCQPYRGDTILVMGNNAWQYNNPADGLPLAVNENVTVMVPGVRIVGYAPSGSIGVPWTVPSAASVALTVGAPDVLVEGFVFTGTNAMAAAISNLWDGITNFGDNLTCRHCTFDDNCTIGVNLSFSYYADIHSNEFLSGGYGVYADPAASAVSLCRIHDNLFADPVTCAIYWLEGTNSEIDHNRIYVADAVAANLSTDRMITTASGANNFVHHNTMSCLLPAAANGDYDDCNSSAATDAWVHNYCLNGPSVTRPT